MKTGNFTRTLTAALTSPRLGFELASEVTGLSAKVFHRTNLGPKLICART